MLTAKLLPPPRIVRHYLPQGTGPGALYDGAGNAVRVPVVPQDFKDLGLQVPDYLWPCQETSGNLASTIGSLTLTANGSPTYANDISDWDRNGVGFTEGANQRFSAAAASGPNPASTSVAWLVYFQMSGNVSAVNRRVVAACDGLTTTGVMANLTTSNVLRVICVNVGANGSYNYNDGAAHPLLLVYDRTNSLVRAYTDKEQVNGTYAAGAVDAAKGIGAMSNSSFPGYIVLTAAAAGSVAESYGKATLSALGWTLAY